MTYVLNLNTLCAFVSMWSKSSLFFTGTYLFTLEVIGYFLEYASILHVQKLYQVYQVVCDYRIFSHSVWAICIFTPFLLSQYLAIFDIHVVYQANIDICINYLQVVRSNLIMFQICLAQKISRLVASFSLEPISEDFVFFILFIRVVKF